MKVDYNTITFDARTRSILITEAYWSGANADAGLGLGVQHTDDNFDDILMTILMPII